MPSCPLKKPNQYAEFVGKAMGEAHTVRETAAIRVRVAAAVVSYFLYTWIVKIIVRNLTMPALGFERETTRKMFIP